MKLLRLFCILIIITLTYNISYSQISINTTGATPDSSAMMDISSDSTGILIPRMAETQKLNIASPSIGLMVYQTDGYAGFYYWEGSKWLLLAASEPQVWSQTWQVYGEMYENNPLGTDIQLSIADQYYGFVSAIEGDISGPGYVTFEDNVDGDRIVIGSLGGGIYLINVSASFVGSNNANMQGAVFINGILQPELRYVTTLAGNARDATSLSGIITLEAYDYISFAFASQAANDFVHLFYINISISRISL